MTLALDTNQHGSHPPDIPSLRQRCRLQMVAAGDLMIARRASGTVTTFSRLLGDLIGRHQLKQTAPKRRALAPLYAGSFWAGDKEHSLLCPDVEAGIQHAPEPPGKLSHDAGTGQLSELWRAEFKSS